MKSIVSYLFNANPMDQPRNINRFVLAAFITVIFFLISVFLPAFLGGNARSQNIGINTTGAVPNTSAMLDISSTTSGLLPPRMTKAQRDAISTPATGLFIYQTDNTPGFYYYDGSSWVPLLSTGQTNIFNTTNVTTTPTPGTILSSGYIQPLIADAHGYQSAAMPGTFGHVHGENYAGGVEDCDLWFLAFMAVHTTNIAAPVSAGVKGTRVSIKGIYQANADAKIIAANERMSFGIVFHNSINGVGGATKTTASVWPGNTTEVNRDNLPSLMVIVDDAENIQSYNCAGGGDASYTDSGFNADLSAGTPFEIIVESPAASNSDNDLFVTMKIQDNGGTMRTIFNAVTPASIATTNGFFPLLIMNQNATVYNCVYLVEKI